MDTLELVKDLLKNYQRNTQLIKLSNLNQESSNDLSNENIGHLSQQMNLLNCSIDCLNSKEKQVIEMIYFNYNSLQEIADVLHTVKSNIYRIKENSLKNIEKTYKMLEKMHRS